jgi:iron complex transport system substrate-binding protein
MRSLLIALLLLSGAARAAEITDATGRSVAVPEHVARILPAGPPAAVLLEALAPDLMLGFPNPVPPEARALLAPEVATLPTVPRLTGKQDATEQVRALKPDLILDYGDVTPAYADLARKTQERLGVPTLLLDGALAETPHALRLLGAALHREARAETLARVAEAMLALPAAGGKHTVVYLRGTDALRAAAVRRCPDAGHRQRLRCLAGAARGAHRARLRGARAAVRLGRGAAVAEPAARSRLVQRHGPGRPRGTVLFGRLRP